MYMYYTMCKYTDMQEATYMLHVNNCTHTVLPRCYALLAVTPPPPYFRAKLL